MNVYRNLDSGQMSMTTQQFFFLFALKLPSSMDKIERQTQMLNDEPHKCYTGNAHIDLKSTNTIAPARQRHDRHLEDLQRIPFEAHTRIHHTLKRIGIVLGVKRLIYRYTLFFFTTIYFFFS